MDAVNESEKQKRISQLQDRPEKSPVLASVEEEAVLDGDSIEGKNMIETSIPFQVQANPNLLGTLEQLLAIETIEVRETLTQASNLVAKVLKADKVDIFLYDAPSDMLISMGVSQTPSGELQQQLGLDHLPLKNGGRTVLVYQNRQSFMTGHSEQDPEELVGIVEDLGIRSVLAVPLYVKEELRGVLEVNAKAPDTFSEHDLHFVEAVAGWISIIIHRSELIEKTVEEARQEERRATAEELITTIAHDLRNYFAPIEGWLGLLRKGALRDKRTQEVEYLHNLGNIIQQLNRKIENLLDVSRLDREPFSLDKKPVEIVALAKEIAASFSSKFAPVLVEAPAQLFLEADEVRLRQALENLVANALNHSPQDAPVIIRISQEDAQAQGPGHPPVNVTIAVIDKGRGIEPRLIPLIFKRFVKLPGSSGLGLGLYLVKEIARAHGGSVAVETAPGGGTSFILSLPLH